MTDILQIVKDSVGDPSVTADHSSKPSNSSLLSATEKQRVIQYSSYELDEHEESASD